LLRLIYLQQNQSLKHLLGTMCLSGEKNRPPTSKK
jgi:hypothetical protein